MLFNITDQPKILTDHFLMQSTSHPRNIMKIHPQLTAILLTHSKKDKHITCRAEVITLVVASLTE